MVGGTNPKGQTNPKCLTLHVSLKGAVSRVSCLTEPEIRLYSENPAQ